MKSPTAQNIATTDPSIHISVFNSRCKVGKSTPNNLRIPCIQNLMKKQLMNTIHRHWICVVLGKICFFSVFRQVIIGDIRTALLTSIVFVMLIRESDITIRVSLTNQKHNTPGIIDMFIY